MFEFLRWRGDRRRRSPSRRIVTRSHIITVRSADSSEKEDRKAALAALLDALAAAQRSQGLRCSWRSTIDCPLCAHCSVIGSRPGWRNAAEAIRDAALDWATDMRISVRESITRKKNVQAGSEASAAGADDRVEEPMSIGL